MNKHDKGVHTPVGRSMCAHLSAFGEYDQIKTNQNSNQEAMKALVQDFCITDVMSHW